MCGFILNVSYSVSLLVEVQRHIYEGQRMRPPRAYNNNMTALPEGLRDIDDRDVMTKLLFKEGEEAERQEIYTQARPPPAT